jgi:hypothetical protein
MRSSAVALVMCGLVVSCADAPTRPASLSANSAVLARDAGDPRPGAIIVRFDGRDFPFPVPETGTCLFEFDGSGELNNFIRTNPDGTTLLRLQDQSGRVTVQLVTGHTWVGTGRLNMNWPDYRGTVDTADNFELTINGTVSEQGKTANVVCKDIIAHGIGVQRFIQLN